VNDESVEAMDDRGSDSILFTLLEGTLRYDEFRLPSVDMDDLSGRDMRMPSGMWLEQQAHVCNYTDLRYELPPAAAESTCRRDVSSH
jgi:hypothetical protein